MKDQQLPQCNSLDVRGKTPRPLTKEQSLGLGVAKAPDHLEMITLGVNSVKSAKPGYNYPLRPSKGAAMPLVKTARLAWAQKVYLDRGT